MPKRTLMKLAGFTIAASCTAALVGVAAHATGAYFTSSHDGTISASTGSVGVNLSPSAGALTFSGLLPGTDQTQAINFQTTGSGTEDLWLIFDTSADPHGNKSEPFTGMTSDTAPGPLGRYGHLKVTSNWGASFESTNLSTPPSSVTNPSVCFVTTNGEGGENQQLANPDDHTIPYCAPTAPIELADNVPASGTGTVNIAFGYTKLATVPPLTSSVSYKIVATQHGIRPDDPFGAASPFSG
jgi:hypothetical protein